MKASVYSSSVARSDSLSVVSRSASQSAQLLSDVENSLETSEATTFPVGYIAELCELGSLEKYLLADSEHEKELTDDDRLRLCVELFSGRYFFSVFICVFN
jgi:hypothetical protein